MGLFVRESGPAGAPTVVFLHGGHRSGWSWEPVVERLQHYRCLVPDLPQYGKSFEQGPFEMGRAADNIADLIRTEVGGGSAHLVGFSLGAQVGLQLLATEPELVDRAVLSGTLINTMPYAGLTEQLAALPARSVAFRWIVNRYWNIRPSGVPAAKMDEYRADISLTTGAGLADIVKASAGFGLPAGLDKSTAPTLFLTGSRENMLVRRWAADIARSMPDAIDRVAIDMRHDWPLRHPGLFARTVDAWLSWSALPPEIT